MRIIRKVAEMAAFDANHAGLVPTMGAFHEGHLSLMRKAKAENGSCVVSLFVNPTQFGPNEDLSRYPRPFERDVQLAEEAGVDILFAPEAGDMYPGHPTVVRVPAVSELWEGAHRPGHFDGVATVVLKLFNIVGPKRAYFGQKDLQQCLVIRKMVNDLNVQIHLSFEATIRESDGLAMSSRNVYLSPQDRLAAVLLPTSLQRLAEKLQHSSKSESEVETLLAQERCELESGGFKVDYFALASLPDLQPTLDPSEPSALIAAARIGSTRLIDNRILAPYSIE